MKRVVVVGGGFYGLWTSAQLVQSGIEVTIVEKNTSFMLEASMINQGRIHNGHHYPRSFETFASSNRNYEKFTKDFSKSVFTCENPIYLISQNSKVNEVKFQRICRIFDEELLNLPKSITDLGKISSISAGWKVKESYFNSQILLTSLLEKIDENFLIVKKDSEVMSIQENDKGVSIVRLEKGKLVKENYDAAVVATYGNIDLLNEVKIDKPKLKFEVCEIVNVEPPKGLKESSITILDGPFWSLTPWPAFGNYALTHVRYTPTATFNTYREASKFMDKRPIKSNFMYMQKDMVSYNQVFSEVKKIKSFFVIKCIIPDRETSDSRPILYKFSEKGNVLLVIGGKMDNVYDLEAVIKKFKLKVGVKN